MLDITLEETRVFQEAIEIGEKRANVKIIFRLLKKRFGQEVPLIDARANFRFAFIYSPKVN